MEIPSLQLQSLNKIDKPISLLKDKDKLFIVANICISKVNKEDRIHMLMDIQNYFEKQLDNTVKFFVMPVLIEEKQGIEILNPKFADAKLLNELKENYEKILVKLEEISLKNE
jgi:hypothetical protein